MTTNEPVIIDGVDVSRCMHYFNKGCLNSGKALGVFCLNNPYCYYKQLQREKKLHQEANEQAFKDEKELYNLNIKLQRKTAECEALHTELKFKVEYIQEQREVIKDLEKKLKIAIEALKDIYDKADEIYFDQYRTSLFCKQVRGISIQALEELE